ncbi:MAG TPA: phosphatidate cytidylyltransferase [Acidimicrobiales bacterium]
MARDVHIDDADPVADELDRPPHRPERATYVDPTPTGMLRIDAIAAGAFAARSERTELPDADDRLEEDDCSITEVAEFELPAWVDPPTGAVPRVLLEQSDVAGTTSELLRGPTWRQEAESFLEDIDLSFLIPEDGPDDAMAGRLLDPEAPFAFVLDEDREVAPVLPELEALEVGDEGAWHELLTPPQVAPRTKRRHGAHRARYAAPATPAGKRNLWRATLTGVMLAGVALGCFFVGAIATEVLVAVAATVAAGELFAVLQRGSYRPATWVGLLAVPAMTVGAYLRGPLGIIDVVAVTFLVLGVWCLSSKSGDEALINFSVSFLVIGWVGGCGAFAALLLSPAAHPHGHGVALIGCTIALVVANDIGAYLVGSKFGRRHLAAKISPGKTVEGLLGGTVLSLIVAGALVSRVHPFTLGVAVLLGVVVSALAPCGDLLESKIKRDLGVKDMSNLLPSHGGLFDRIDATLFVLPAAYVLFAIARLH